LNFWAGPIVGLGMVWPRLAAVKAKIERNGKSRIAPEKVVTYICAAI
jgi:hypothetical protein